MNLTSCRERGAFGSLVRIEMDTALSRVGESDHDVKLCLERAIRYHDQERADYERTIDRAEAAERLVELYRENGSADLTRLVEYEAKLQMRKSGN